MQIRRKLLLDIIETNDTETMTDFIIGTPVSYHPPLFKTILSTRAYLFLNCFDNPLDFLQTREFGISIEDSLDAVKGMSSIKLKKEYISWLKANYKNLSEDDYKSMYESFSNKDSFLYDWKMARFSKKLFTKRRFFW